jgi:hypothetical protein
MQVVAVLSVVALCERRAPRLARLRPGTGVGGAVVAALAAAALTRALAGGAGDYAHVVELGWAKLRFLGQLPDDPRLLSFGARLLWQGPFATGSIGGLSERLGLLLPFVVVAAGRAAPGLWRGGGDARVQSLAVLAAGATLGALAVERLIVLAGLVAPVAATVVLARLGSRSRRALAAVVFASQLAWFAAGLPALGRGSWYPPVERANLLHFLDWARAEIADGEPIAADFVNSPAILAHTGHPVVLQPKYEIRRSRDRIEAFLTTFFHGSTADLHRLLREQLGCRYLLVDVHVLAASRYQAGIGRGERVPPAGAAAAFLSSDVRRFDAIPGFRLIYRGLHTPPTWRLYRVEDRIE